MDKLVEIIAPYWMSWQETALDNPQFSAVLAVSAFVIGYVIMAILKSVKISGLKRELAQQKILLDENKSKQDEFLIQKKNDSEQIASFQQQVEQLSNQLEKEKRDHNQTFQLKMNCSLQQPMKIKERLIH